MNDPEFQADAEKRQVDLEFTSGAEIQALIDKIYKTPPAVSSASRSSEARINCERIPRCHVTVAQRTRQVCTVTAGHLTG